MKYYRVTGDVMYTNDNCKCPNCDGHTVNVMINQLVASPNNDRDGVDVVALTMSNVPTSAYWEYGPHIQDVTLETLERKALEEWNLHLPVKHSLALAMARGEL